MVKTHLKDKIYQARIVSISEKPNLFCEECGSEISADEKFCTGCGTEKPEPSSPSTSDEPEPTPEPEIKQETESIEEHASGGFAFTSDGDIGGRSTRETAREDLTRKISDLETKLNQTKATKSRQQELEEYEKKYLNESATKVTWKAYDVKAKRKVEIQNPKAVKMKNGKWAVKGTSPITGIKVFRIVGNEKPAVSSEKIADSPKAKKEQTTPAEKPKGSQKTEPEVFSRYYRSPEAESPKVKSKSKKHNPFCEECGSKIAAKDMFCINCGAKR